MKKIILLLVIVFFGAVAFADPPKAVTPKTVAKKTAMPPTPAQGLAAVTLNQMGGGIPSACFGLVGWTLDAGGTIANVGNTTTVTLLLRGEIPIKRISNAIRTYVAPTLLLISGGGTSDSTFNLLFGCEYMFTSPLAIFADLTALRITSGRGTPTWAIGGNDVQIYTGARLYL